MWSKKLDLEEKTVKDAGRKLDRVLVGTVESVDNGGSAMGLPAKITEYSHSL